MTDREIWLKLITDLKKENMTLKQDIEIKEHNYQQLHKAYNKLLKFLEDK